jgi:hypothetical protein
MDIFDSLLFFCVLQKYKKIENSYPQFLSDPTGSRRYAVFDVTQVNEAYRVASLEEEQVRKYFEKGKVKDPKAEWLSASDVVDILSEILTVRITYGAKQRVGRALVAMGCDVKRVHGIQQYCVRRLNNSENEQTEMPLEQPDSK